MVPGVVNCATMTRLSSPATPYWPITSAFMCQPLPTTSSITMSPPFSKADTHSGSLPSAVGGKLMAHPLSSSSQVTYESYCKAGKNANNSADEGSAEPFTFLVNLARGSQNNGVQLITQNSIHNIGRAWCGLKTWYVVEPSMPLSIASTSMPYTSALLITLAQLQKSQSTDGYSTPSS